MNIATKIITIEAENEKGDRIYVGAYADEKTAQRVRDNIELFVPEGFGVSTDE